MMSAGILSLPTKPQPKAAPPTSSGRGVLLCLLSAPGLGKSTLLSHFNDVSFVCDSRDRGILDLMDYSKSTGVHLKRNQVSIAETYERFKETLEAEVNDPSIKAIVCESLVGIQALCTDYTLRTDYDSKTNKNANNQFINYRNGHDICANVHFQAILDIMLKGQDKGKNMFLTGHSKIGTAKNVVGGEDWVSQVTESSPEIARRVNATFANIFHIGTILATNRSGGKVRPETEDFVYKIYVDHNPFYPAKNRMGLVGEVEYPRDKQAAALLLCKLLSINPATGLRRSSSL